MSLKSCDFQDEAPRDLLWVLIKIVSGLLIGVVVDGDNVVDDGFEGRRRNESGSIYT